MLGNKSSFKGPIVGARSTRQFVQIICDLIFVLAIMVGLRIGLHQFAENRNATSPSLVGFLTVCSPYILITTYAVYSRLTELLVDFSISIRESKN